jgi:hypothetical protein
MADLGIGILYAAWLPVLAIGTPTIIGVAPSRRFRAWITEGMT